MMLTQIADEIRSLTTLGSFETFSTLKRAPKTGAHFKIKCLGLHLDNTLPIFPACGKAFGNTGEFLMIFNHFGLCFARVG